MNMQSDYLQKNEQLALQDCAERLTEFFGQELRQLWLFGSKARGDFGDDSDLDLLIVLRQITSEQRSIVRRIAARVSLENDVLINTHILEEAQWKKAVLFQDTLWREIQRDGISLLHPEPA